MNIEEIIKNNKEWAKTKLNENSQYFDDLAKDQKPKILYIGCSDSRVTAEELMGATPGEVFVHRNIANMVISIDLNAMSVINYAVNQLEVEHIIICGHYGCGGVLEALKNEDLGILNPWLRNIRDVYRIHKDELNLINDAQKKNDRLVELNVQEQCINIIKTACVQQAFRRKNIQVHGWVFDIKTGLLRDLKIDFPKILNQIMEIYKLE